ncbi:MAG: metal-dependent transcriptional regulator [Anaerovoracaceae bacterium]|nr:metal-dependent transcriptional regulator [Bacillota bacterium]MDY2670557.1 metal-dependent transcriptional regulator [Anaerovoracaceae bacterium]
MKIHESAENYLETILMLSKKNQVVRSIDIANELGFSKPSVSIAMKKLRENGYVKMDGNGYITLAKPGLDIATKIYERHVLITKVLEDIGVDPQIAADDACRVEHVISNETFDRIKEYVKENEADSAENE